MGEPPQEQSPFIYERLDDSSSAIRIIEVLPASLDGHVQLTMRLIHMPAKYRCLSYMWGDTTEDHEILVNGSPMPVRENLYRFLQTAQQRYSQRPFWIDAICINQKNHIEKNHQVQMMGRIYQGAEEVLVWLGVDPRLNLVFDTVNAGRRRRAMMPDSPIPRTGPFSIEQLHSLVNGLVHLSENPYWMRTWIAQEVFSAQRVRLTNGLEEMQWDRLLFVMAYVRRHPDTREKVSRLRLYLYMDEWIRRKGFADHSIWKLLHWLSQSQCMDQRDRIYGLLSLIDDGATFDVDYEEDVHSLFWRAGEHFRAWAEPDRIMSLCHALGLTIPRLRSHLVSSGSRAVTLEVERLCPREAAPAQPDTWVPHRPEKVQSQLSCHGCKLSFDAEESDILLCLKAWCNPLQNCPHALHALVRLPPNLPFSSVLISECCKDQPKYWQLGPGSLLYLKDSSWIEENSHRGFFGRVKRPTQYRIKLPATDALDVLFDFGEQNAGKA